MEAEKALAILSKFLKEKKVARQDYKELCGWLFLGGAVDGFKFQYSGAHHHAH